jgi:hypothetical protein
MGIFWAELQLCYRYVPCITNYPFPDRVLPHQQNTGGFFVALLEKTALCPWEAAAKSAATKQESAPGAVVSESDAATATTVGDNPPKVFEPSQKKRKFFGFREDPFVYLKVLY